MPPGELNRHRLGKIGGIYAMRIPEMEQPFRGGIAIMIHGAGYRRAIPLFIWLLGMGDEEDAARRIPFDLRGWELIGLCA